MNSSSQLESIFFAALGKGTSQERAAFLDEACAGDNELRRHLERMLEAQAVGFMQEPALGHPTADYEPIKEGPGEVIGPYKLMEQIGEGGFGLVFLAEQHHPVRRKVALKIIRPGMDTRDVIARFEAERQALAMMDHPNIAKVLDAGTTGEGNRVQGTGDREDNSALALSPDTCSLSPNIGRPYFVMELVQGVPITEYCDQCNLTTGERLELFIIVCQAVQHAHQKGIIHRDLKPTNVLVAIQDGQPSPKIIDFGVAKAIGQQLTEHTLTTAFAQMVGTPLYMSPEQAELSPLSVDTRSDIYSLGVLLYELLAGTTPFDKDRLYAAPYDELRSIIREEEPLRPSARITTLAADKASTIAEYRRTDARRLSQQVRGELDWIVMKCLEKDRNRRYESPASLARDIERYLHDEPVQACPPSTSYRFRKFARRNKALLAAGSAIAAALFIGLGLSTWMYFRERTAVQMATTESARAQAVSNLLQEMLGSADAERAKGSQYTVRELLDDFSGGLGNQLAEEPAAEADIRATIGRAYRSLGMPERGQSHLEQAIELRRQVYGPQHENVAAILVDYGQLLENQMRLEEAEAQLRAALKIYHERGVTGAPIIHALRILQDVLISSAVVTGRNIEAERVTQEALAVAQQNGEEFPELATMLRRFAVMRNQQSRHAEAETLALQAVDMHRRVRKGPHPELAYGLVTLADVLHEQLKIKAAEEAYRESLAIFRRFYPEDHPDVRSTVDALAALLEVRRDKSKMDPLETEIDELEMEEAGSDSPGDHLRLAGLLLTKNRSGNAHQKEARRLIQRAIGEYGRVAIDSPGNLSRRLSAVEGFVDVATLCSADPDFAGELDQVNQKLTAEMQALHITFPDSAECQLKLAKAYMKRAYFSAKNQRQPEAADFLRKAVLTMEGVRDSAYTINALYVLAIVQLRLGDDAAYRESCEAMLQVPGDSRNDSSEFRRACIWAFGPHPGQDLSLPLRQAEERAANNSLGARYFDLWVLGGVHYRAGNFERAAQYLEESIAAYPSDPLPSRGTVLFPQLLLVMTKWQLGERDAARHLLAELQPAINEWLQTPSHYQSIVNSWHRPAILEVLRREAEAMIGQNDANEAVENKSRTSSTPTTETDN